MGSRAHHSQLLTPQETPGPWRRTHHPCKAVVGKLKPTLSKLPGLTISTQETQAAWDRTALRRNPQNLGCGSATGPTAQTLPHDAARNPRGRRGRCGNGRMSKRWGITPTSHSARTSFRSWCKLQAMQQLYDNQGNVNNGWTFKGNKGLLGLRLRCHNDTICVFKRFPILETLGNICRWSDGLHLRDDSKWMGERRDKCID